MPREQRVNKPSGTPETSTVPKTTAERRGIRQERIPQGIVYMLTATILFAGSSALSKWLVATYPIGEMLFVRAAAALIGSGLVFLPANGLFVFRIQKLRDHPLPRVSHGRGQTFFVILFRLMPAATPVAVNFF